MKFEIVKETILKRLMDLNSIVDRKTTQPILNHVYIEAKEGKIRMISTDTEVTLEGMAKATVLEEGITTVPCDKFFQIIQKLEDNSKISCHLENSQFHIRTKSSQFKLATLPAEDFPVAQNITYETELNLDAAILYNLLNKVRFSLAKQDPRHYLTGLLIQVVAEGNAVNSVTTDGHRLSCATAQLAKSATEGTKIIIPEKTVNELVKHLSLDMYSNEYQLEKVEKRDVEGVNKINETLEKIKDLRNKSLIEQISHFPRAITLNINAREFSLNIPGYTLTSRLIDGQYPDYRNVIPQEQETPILVARTAFLSALRRANVLLNNRQNGIRLTFVDHQLKLSARNLVNETAEEVLDVVNAAKKNIEIGLNINYLIDVISNIDGDSLQLHFESADKPCMITSQDDLGVRYIIMPMYL